MRSIRNTDIIVKKCGKIVFGIICFCSSGVYSLFFVLKVDIFVNKIFRNRSVSEMLFVLVLSEYF